MSMRGAYGWRPQDGNAFRRHLRVSTRLRDEAEGGGCLSSNFGLRNSAFPGLSCFGLAAPLLAPDSRAGTWPAAPGRCSGVESLRAGGPEGRRDACPALRKCPGHPVLARGGYAAANEHRGSRIEGGKTRAHKRSCQECESFRLSSLEGPANAKAGQSRHKTNS